MEAVKDLPAPGLPPMPSPKFKSRFWQRIHKQGCPPEMRCREHLLKPSSESLRMFPIGMLSESHTDAKRKHTIIWLENM